MFKPAMLRRGFSLWTRTPNHRIVASAARDGHETVRVQSVRFKRPFFRRPRLIGPAFFALGVYAFLRVETHLFDEVPEESQEWQRVGDEGEEDDDDEDGEDGEVGSLLFFPTGFSRPKPRTFYKPKDPEWQEFIRISKDKEAVKALHKQVADHISSAIEKLASKDAGLARKVGKVDPKKVRYWLEVRWPSGPPIEYERPGIEVREDLSVAFSTRPVAEVHHSILASSLMPKNAAVALYFDTKIKVVRAWSGFRSAIGWEDKTTQKKKALEHILAPPPLLPGSDSAGQSSPTDRSTLGPVTAPSTSTAAAVEAQSTSQKPSSTPLVTIFNPGVMDMKRFLMAFLSRRLKDLHQEIKMSPPPRGMFTIVGRVDVAGSLSRMHFDVYAVYDPKEKTLVKIITELKEILPKYERARG